MADQNSIEKVYDVKTIGGRETYQTLSDINQMFIQIKENKQSFNGNFSLNIDNSSLTQLDKSIQGLIIGMKDLGVIGQKMAADISAAMARVNMSTMPNIIAFKEFQASINPVSINTYANSITSLGAKLSGLKDRSIQLSETQKRTREELDKNVIEQGEYNARMAETTTELQMVKTQITEVSGAMTTMNKLFNPALIQEETAAQAENSNILASKTRLLKLETEANLSMAGSVREARAQIALMNREQENLIVIKKEGIEITDEEIAANIKRREELIAEKNTLHEFIAANADANLARKLNIGNYPNVSAELTDLKVKMQQLVLAGEQNSEEFKKMSARAQELAASMREVARDTGRATFSIENISKRVETMGFRMLIHLAIFTLAIEAIMKITEGIGEVINADKKLQEENEELKKSYAELTETTRQFHEKEIADTELLLSHLTNLNASYDQRYDAVKKLIELYPELLQGMTTESMLADGIKDKQEKLNDILEYQATMKGINLDKDKTNEALVKAKGELSDAGDKLNAENAGDLSPNLFSKSRQKIYDEAKNKVDDLQHHIEQLGGVAEDVQASLDELLHPKHEGINQSDLQNKVQEATYNLSQTLQYSEANKKAIKDLAKAQKDLDDYLGNKDKAKVKGEHDYTAAKLEAAKKLTDFLAREAEIRLQTEMVYQKDLADNASRSLDQRLNAYAGYAANEKKILKLQNEAQVKDVQDKLDKIGQIENAQANKKAKLPYDKSFFDNDGKLRVESQTLLINKEALNAQLDYLNTDYKEKLAHANSNITKEIAGITASSISKMLKDIELDASNRIADLKSNATSARKNLQGGEYQKQQGAITIDDNLNVDTDKANLGANSEEQIKLQEQIDAARIAKKTDDEKQMMVQLQNLKNEAADLNEKLRQDEDKKKKDGLAEDKKIQQELVSQSINAFQEIGNAYVNMLQQQASYREQQTQRELEFNKKILDNQAQSNQQKLANDKAYALEQQQLEKEKAKESLKIAEAQMAMDYAVGVMKIWSVNAVDPVIAGLETAGLTAVYTAKLTMMASQQFGAGGDVPSNGGMFGGRSHAAGGTPFLYNGGRFEAEAGEIAIINKNSSGSNQVMTVTGTPKQIASGINAHGGGYNFAPGASIHKYAWGGSLGAQIQPPVFVGDYYTRQADNGQGSAMELAKALQMHIDSTASQFHNLKVSLDHRDVTAAQNQQAKAVSVGTFGGK